MKHLLTAVFLTCAPMTLLAQDQTPQAQILSQLTAQGFEIERMSRTLLGRVRVVSSNGRLERETVFNPRTGHVLRDIWRTISDDGDEVAGLLSPPGEGGEGESSGSGGGGYEDDDSHDDGYEDDADEYDEEDETDESDDETDDSEDSEDSDDTDESY